MNRFILFISIVFLVYSCNDSADSSQTLQTESIKDSEPMLTFDTSAPAPVHTFDPNAHTPAFSFDPNAAEPILTFEPVPAGTRSEKQAQVKLLISISRQTMDSIDAAYILVRGSSRVMDLSIEERENVNEALQQMNVAKELIVLETQKEIIDQLRQKTNSLNSMIDQINKTSFRLNQISNTISKVSSLIERTTNMLSSGFAIGIIKPKTAVAN